MKDNLPLNRLVRAASVSLKVGGSLTVPYGYLAPNLAVSWQMLAPLEQSFVGVRRNEPGTSGNLGLVPVYLVKARYISPMPPSVALSDLRKMIYRIVRAWRPLSSERFNRVTGDGCHGSSCPGRDAARYESIRYRCPN